MFPDENEAEGLLEKYAPDDSQFMIVLNHGKKVAELGMKFAERVPGANRKLIKIGAILHDIGRFLYPPPGRENAARHGIAGADILRNEGIDEAICRIAERHVGVGIWKEDIISMKLTIPHLDYLPETDEEKIVAYADNIAGKYPEDDLKAAEKMVEERFAREVGMGYGMKTRKFHEEMHLILGM